MKMWKFYFIFSAFGFIHGCASAFTPSTQPTESGVLSVTSMYEAIIATEQAQLAAFDAGLITKDQLRSELPLDRQAKAAADAARDAALRGDSAAAGLAAVATTAIRNAQSTTRPTH